MNRHLLYAIAGISFAAYPLVRSQHMDLKMKGVDMRFTATDGTPVDLAQMRGKVVLIDFWATWCPGCMQEAPHVVEAYNALHDQGFEVVGISLDVDKGQMESIAQQKGMLWPEYFDGKAWNNDVATHFGIHQIPALWLLDKNGRLADTDAREDLQEKVSRLLAQ
jgi:peroxiredoxin